MYDLAVWPGDTLFREVKRERPPGKGKRDSSPQKETLLSQETGVKEPTIPPQKAVPHKEDRNVSTPSKVTSRPPQG